MRDVTGVLAAVCVCVCVHGMYKTVNVLCNFENTHRHRLLFRTAIVNISESHSIHAIQRTVPLATDTGSLKQYAVVPSVYVFYTALFLRPYRIVTCHFLHSARKVFHRLVYVFH